MATVFPSKEKKTLLMNMLKVLGGHRAVVEFQGGGDSGEIYNAVLYDQNMQEIDCTGITFDWDSESETFDPVKNTWDKHSKFGPVPVLDILRDVTEQMLENEGLDWYNNDGGQGQLTIDLTQSPPTIVLFVGINFTQTDDHEFDYTDADEDDEGGEEVKTPFGITLPGTVTQGGK